MALVTLHFRRDRRSDRRPNGRYKPSVEDTQTKLLQIKEFDLDTQCLTWTGQVFG